MTIEDLSARTGGRFTARQGIERGSVWIEDTASRDGGDFPVSDVEALLESLPENTTAATAAVEQFYNQHF